jgi:hypothetical protein
MIPSIPVYMAGAAAWFSHGTVSPTPVVARPTTTAQGASMATAISTPWRHACPRMRIQTTIGQAMNRAIPTCSSDGGTRLASDMKISMPICIAMTISAKWSTKRPAIGTVARGRKAVAGASGTCVMTVSLGRREPRAIAREADRQATSRGTFQARRSNK